MPVSRRDGSPMDFRRQVFCLMGIPFDLVTLETLQAHIRATASRGERCVLTTPNVNIIIGALRNERYRDDILKSDLCVVDGMPIIWLARLMGLPLLHRVSGSDLFDRLRERRGEPPLSVFFFGGEGGSGALAQQKVNADAGGLVCVGHLEPSFGSAEALSDPALIEQINRHKPDFLILSLGAEKAQLWIERNLKALDAPIICHLGAVLKFAAGTVARAPTPLRSTGLEWLWRMKEEPFLWKRYWNDGVGMLRLLVTRHLRYVLTRPMFESHKVPARVRVVAKSDAQMLRLQGSWRADNLDPLREAFEKVAATGQRIGLDLAGVRYLDCAAVGLLLLLRGHCLRIGVTMQIIGASPQVRRLFHFHCVDYLLDTLESIAPVTRIQPETATEAAAPAFADATAGVAVSGAAQTLLMGQAQAQAQGQAQAQSQAESVAPHP